MSERLIMLDVPGVLYSDRSHARLGGIPDSGTCAMSGSSTPLRWAMSAGSARARDAAALADVASRSIVSGASVGKEGAMIQLAALCGSLFPSTRIGRPDGASNMQRMLTACGAAAGLATVYHTPLSAAVFVAEVVFGALAVQRLMPLFLASVAGAVVSQWHGGLQPLYPGLHIVPDLRPQLLLAAAALGIAAGIVGALFLRGASMARGRFAQVPGGPVARLALGGALVAVRGHGRARSGRQRLLHDPDHPAGTAAHGHGRPGAAGQACRRR